MVWTTSTLAFALSSTTLGLGLGLGGATVAGSEHEWPPKRTTMEGVRTRLESLLQLSSSRVQLPPNVELRAEDIAAGRDQQQRGLFEVQDEEKMLACVEKCPLVPSQAEISNSKMELATLCQDWKCMNQKHTREDCAEMLAMLLHLDRGIEEVFGCACQEACVLKRITEE